MLSDALSFPRRGNDWLPTLLVGGILTLLSPLVLPAIVVQGYLVRVLSRAARGERTPPSFTQWGTLFVDGLKAFVVNVVYTLVVLVPATFVFAGLVVIVPGEPMAVEPGTTPPAPPTTPDSGLLVFLALVVVLVLAGLAVTYVLPAALANFAIEGRLGAAFDLRAILGGAFTREYAVAWVLALVVGTIGGLLGSALSLVIVGIFLLFYVQVSVYYLLGRGFAAGLQKKR